MCIIHLIGHYYKHYTVYIYTCFCKYMYIHIHVIHLIGHLSFNSCHRLTVNVQERSLFYTVYLQYYKRYTVFKLCAYTCKFTLLALH